MNRGLRLICCFLFETGKWERERWDAMDKGCNINRGGYYFNLDLRVLQKELGTYKGMNFLVKGYYF